MVSKVDIQEEPRRENLEQSYDSEAEEALSFCDLPIYDRATSTTANWGGDDDGRRPSTADQDLFEFFSDLRADVCPSNGVIFCGKLIPYKEKECYSEQILDDHNDDDGDDNQYCNIKSFFRRRRSESLNELQRSRSSAKDRMMQNNHSLDDRKLQRHRNMSGKCSGKANFSSSPSAARPWWPLLMFGMVKVPKEMKLKDIKNRQNRRTPTSFLPEFVTGCDADKVGVRREEEKGSWRLLRALSCRGHASAKVVTSSLGCIPLV